MKETYEKLVIEGKLQEDKLQAEFVALLASLQKPLEMRIKANVISKYFTKPLKSKISQKDGLYVYGEVGRGKSYLLNLFLQQFNPKHVRRQHFHQFMQAVHKLLEIHRKKALNIKQKKTSIDILKSVVKNICGSYKIFFVDELFVKNIADAMLVLRIFRIMKRSKIFVIFASNREPNALYLNGLQRNRFMEFIHMIEKNYILYSLNNKIDYRELGAKTLNKKLFFGNQKARNKFLNSIIDSLNLNAFEKLEIEIEENRHITAHKICGEVAIFSFEELCIAPKSVKDYAAICNHFKTIIVHNIPILNDNKRNAVLRFINLIDCIYDAGTNFIATFEVDFREMYTGTKYEFEFKRTVSRLKHFID